MSAERMTARVTGRVQGVGFRWWVRTCAGQLALTGWVTNADDERTVEVLAEGEPAALDELERWLHIGPDGARVETVEARRQPASGTYDRFRIVRG